MTALTPGANAPLPGPVVLVAASPGLDVTALVVSADDKVSGDADMVFFNQPQAPGVTWSGNTVLVDLGRLRPGAVKVVLLASPDTEGAGFGQVTVTLTSGGETVTFTPPSLGSETALILCELYERGGAFKVRAVGQGYDSGLAGVATDFGITVDDPPPTPTTSLTKGEERLPIDMRKRLNLRKQQVAVVLEKHRMTGLRCRVVLVLDVSGSTRGLYKRGVISRAVERVAPVAAQVDDGAEMQAWAMGKQAVRLDDLTIGALPQWIETYAAKRFEGAGGENNEEAVMRAVRAFVAEEPLEIPTFVLWFHDGGVNRDKAVERMVRDAVPEPVFWQFVGLGAANYGILQRLDDLEGRQVDNTGFFALDDIDALADEDLYALLLAELPSWVRAYYPAGHPALRGLS